MRKHEVECRIEGDKSNADLQNNINLFTVSCIQRVLQESALPKAEQLKIVDGLLKELKSGINI